MTADILQKVQDDVDRYDISDVLHVVTVQGLKSDPNDFEVT
eukprot:CAMPEP_0185773292 /NCGR_PEP_ID=MMETSP1174-20130828/72833_1 /TAXON_ID=35687 /ORGANISM="Dictyocha speculum, Strain CCMP1381" /LENGTH=40 /DNA_ID= /DNA_START= /DNA_END= /DNA_ORIENTATION=